VEEHFVISWISSRGMDGRYSLRRICDNPWVVRSCRSYRGDTVSIPEGSKLRRGRGLGQGHEDRWIYLYIVYRGFVRRRPVNTASGIAILRYAISRKAKRIVWGHKGQSGGQVA
jgi:hypothetical protein